MRRSLAASEVTPSGCHPLILLVMWAIAASVLTSTLIILTTSLISASTSTARQCTLSCSVGLGRHSSLAMRCLNRCQSLTRIGWVVTAQIRTSGFSTPNAVAKRTKRRALRTTTNAMYHQLWLSKLWQASGVRSSINVHHGREMAGSGLTIQQHALQFPCLQLA